MATVAIHQPAYLPWLGYFDKIARADVFVLLDTVQFERGGWINRQLIKTRTGPTMLTVPVQHATMHDLRVAAIDEHGSWRTKHLRTIYQAYSRAPNFGRLWPLLAMTYLHDRRTPSLLTDFCHRQLRLWLGELGIKTPVVRASELDVHGGSSELLLAICKAVGCDTYLSGELGRDYLNEHLFADNGVTVIWQQFRHPRYKQLHGEEFIPRLGVVDACMCTSVLQPALS